VTEYLSRRERKEAERAGISAPPEPITPQAPPEVPVMDAEVAPTSLEAGQFLSRRERRLAEANNKNGDSTKKQPEAVKPLPTEFLNEPESEEPESPEPEPLAPEPEEIAIVPTRDPEPGPDLLLEFDVPPAEFTGSNYLAEPSTQSIVLDISPEAISLPLDFDESTTTGSISIMPEAVTGSITGGLDGSALDEADRADAVTGVISTVEPVSALDVINERVNVGVVPSSVLRKGWWQPWAYSLLGLALLIATILAAWTIIEATGGR
jgi:hypothetical protein